MFEAIIDLNDFATLENTFEVYDTYFESDTGYFDYKTRGYVRVLKEEFAEVMGASLQYEIEESNNLNPKWVFEYKFSIEGIQELFEIIEIQKIENEYVYFKTNV